MIDQIISAEIPLADQDPNEKLFNVILSYMIHGLCGNFNPNAVCMIRANGQLKCSKQFSKAFQETTMMQENKYPFY